MALPSRDVVNMDDEFRFDGSVSKCEGSLGNLRIPLHRSGAVARLNRPSHAQAGSDDLLRTKLPSQFNRELFLRQNINEEL
jgi:hypothetical protein